MRQENKAANSTCAATSAASSNLAFHQGVLRFSSLQLRPHSEFAVLRRPFGPFVFSSHRPETRAIFSFFHKFLKNCEQRYIMVKVSQCVFSAKRFKSVNTDQGTLVEFTLPAETPIYDQMIFQEENQNSMLTHGGGVSGKTIVEPYFAGTEETPCEEYIDHLAGSTRNNPHDDETFTRDLNGREVVIYKRTENTVNAFGTEVCEFRYLFAVPVIENVVLGFQVSGSYGTDNDLVYDDSVIDILLSHITF